MWSLAEYLFACFISVTVVNFKPFSYLSLTSEVFLKCDDFHPLNSIKFYLLPVCLYHNTTNI